MRLRYKFISITGWIFVLMLMYTSTDVTSDTPEAKGIHFVSFNNSWFSKPREYYRIILLTKHMGKTLYDIINMPRKTNITSKMEGSVLSGINYVIDGFYFIGNITKNKDRKIKSLSSSKSSFILTSKYNRKLIEFFKFLEEIERIFHDDFENLRYHSNNNSMILDSFYNKTIKSQNFRNNLLLEEFCYLPNETISFSAQKFNRNIFHMYFETLQQLVNSHYICDESMTTLITNFYERVLIDVFKGYTMLIIGYEFYRLKHRGFDVKGIQNSYFDNYLTTTNKVLYSAKELDFLITLKHRTNRKCDPSAWQEGINYIRVKNYVSDRSNYNVKNFRNFKLKTQMSKEFECSDFGLFFNFAPESIDTMRCPEMFETDSQGCSMIESQEFKFTSYGYPNWSVSCHDKTSYHYFKGLCYCDRHSDTMLSIRTLSLREHSTDSNDDRFVTGIKFVVKNNVISLQIQEGKMVDGIIDPNSVRWVTGEGKDPEEGPPTIKLGFKVKSFNLDDIDLPAKYFVTGVKLYLLEDNHIGLAVRGTQTMNTFGSKPSYRHQWFYPTVSYSDSRENIYIKDYKNSAEVSVQNVETSRSESNYVSLSVGVLSSRFNNMPVIPFFDSQDVVSDPPSPLGGVGLFYKTQPSYGGFFAFKLFASPYTYDFDFDIKVFNGS